MRRVWQEEKGERAILPFMIANDNAIAVGVVGVLASLLEPVHRLVGFYHFSYQFVNDYLHLSRLAVRHAARYTVRSQAGRKE
jgi:hypothetical protein